MDTGVAVVDVVEAIELVQQDPEAEREFSDFLSSLIKDPEVVAGIQERFEDIGAIADLVAEQASTIERLARQVNMLATKVVELERTKLRHLIDNR